MTSGPLTHAQWQAARYRCPCGFAAGDVEEFDRHLEAAGGQEPEHFEVEDGWTLDQVRAWQAAGGGRSRAGRA